MMMILLLVSCIHSYTCVVCVSVLLYWWGAILLILLFVGPYGSIGLKRDQHMPYDRDEYDNKLAKGPVLCSFTCENVKHYSNNGLDNGLVEVGGVYRALLSKAGIHLYYYRTWRAC